MINNPTQWHAWRAWNAVCMWLFRSRYFLQIKKYIAPTPTSSIYESFWPLYTHRPNLRCQIESRYRSDHLINGNSNGTKTKIVHCTEKCMLFYTLKHTFKARLRRAAHFSRANRKNKEIVFVVAIFVRKFEYKILNKTTESTKNIITRKSLDNQGHRGQNLYFGSSSL